MTCQLCGGDRFREDDGAMVCKGCGAVKGGPVDVDLERDAEDHWAREYDNETQLINER